MSFNAILNRACAETSIGTFITPEKCKRYIATWSGLVKSQSKLCARYSSSFSFANNVDNINYIATAT